MSAAASPAAFSRADDTRARVSSRSLLADDLWHLDVATPGATLSEFTLDWDFVLDDGTSFAAERWRPLRVAAKTFLWSLAASAPIGRRRHRAGTLVGQYHRLRVLIRWMARTGYHSFSRLDPGAGERFLAFVRQRPGRGGQEISRLTLRSYANLLDLLYLQREKMPDGLAARIIDQRGFRDLRIRTTDPHVGPATPDEVAMHLINAAIRLIGTPADDIINLRDVLPGGQPVTYCFATVDGEDKPWHTAVADRATKVNFLVDRLYDACFVVIAYLIGARVSEILGLQAGCINTVPSASGGETFDYVSGRIYKTAASPLGEVHRWIAPVPVVRAIAVLERLSEPLRRETGREDLWLRRPVNRLHEIEICRSTVLNDHLNGSFAAFINLPLHDSHPWRLTTHQGRKTFARFVGRRDRTGLHALAAHFGHVTRVMTDTAYVGADHHLADLVDAEVLAETRDALEDVLTATRLGGKAGRAMASHSRFRGRLRDGDVREYVDFILRESDMRLGVCDWGYCVYRRETSACLGGERGPNPVLRTQSACATCANFAVTAKHQPIWEARRKRNLALLSHCDLDDESRALASARLEECDRILDDLESTKDRHG
ncbi:MAG: integrase [Novosphingobium sp.]